MMVAVTNNFRRPRGRRPSPAGLRAAAPNVAAAALLAALGASDMPLGPVMDAIGTVCGLPSTVFWKREGRRLQLAHRRGDDLVPSGAQTLGPLGMTEQDGSGTQGIPLHLGLVSTAEPHVMTIQGHQFGAVPTADGLLAVGPLPKRALGRRERRDLAMLGALVDGPVRQSLRIGALNDQVRSLQQEAELHRRSLGSAIDEGLSLGLLLDLAVSTSGSAGGVVAVRQGQRLEPVAARNAPGGLTALDLTPGAGIISSIPDMPGVLLVDGYDRLLDLGIGGLVAVGGPPDAEEPHIVMALFSATDGVLAPGCAPMLTTLVEVAGIVISSAQAARGTAARHLGALEALCRALDSRAPSTHSHHAHVARVARDISVRVQLPADQVALVVQAAMIHDVGLIAATPEAAIAAEFAHPVVGADMAALVPGAAQLSPIIRAHHEWWDGFGFPNGLLGEAIPIEGRILAAAEFYVETRQANPSVTQTALVDELRSRSGGQLDPTCAQHLIDIIQES